MKRRIDSLFASGALLMLLCLTLLYGCRAFDPEPVVVNRAPDTYLTGAPAETTGAGFRRHMFWYGTDRDGEVVQFIYAITDSIVRDIDEPEEDEEDALFDPAEDVTTLVDSNVRKVGWTTKTDSVFSFTVDLGPTPTKEITFHMVAVDDRGAIDPTPARLRFFNNTLGNPTLQFRMYVDIESDGTGGELRWVGDPSGPDASSPEQTSEPFVGFRKPFRIEWEASSPNFDSGSGNDGIVGYRVKAAQGPAPYDPPATSNGEKRWDPDNTSFVYLNERPASDPEVGANCDPETGTGCDPSIFRFPSGPFDVSVEVLDQTLVESVPSAGFLTFQVNYPPETEILVDATTPSYTLVDSLGTLLQEGVIQPPSGSSLDTIPVGATVTFESSGYDRFADSVPPGEGDLLCCDTPLAATDDTSAVDVPEVRYQTRLEVALRNQPGTDGIFNRYSTPRADDPISFTTGPLDFTVFSRTVDEHGRRDPTPSEFSFVAGFPPRVVLDEFIPGPATGDSLILRFALPGIPPWDANEVDYEVLGNETRYFVRVPSEECGGQLLTSRPSSGVEGQDWQSFQGTIYRFRPRFVGAPDPRDPLSAVRSWSYERYSDGDPQNDVLDPRESRDLSVFWPSPEDNTWLWAPENGLTVWVPQELWINPAPFYPDASELDAIRSGLGCLLRQRLGEFTVRAVGKTTKTGDVYPLYEETEPTGEDDQPNPIRIGDGGGRVSEIVEYKYWIYLGIDRELDGQIDILWPDF